MQPRRPMCLLRSVLRRTLVVSNVAAAATVLLAPRASAQRAATTSGATAAAVSAVASLLIDQLPAAVRSRPESCYTKASASDFTTVPVVLSVLPMDELGSGNKDIVVQAILLSQGLSARVRSALGGAGDRLPRGEPRFRASSARALLRVVSARGRGTAVRVEQMGAGAEVLGEFLAARATEEIAEGSAIFLPDSGGPDSVSVLLVAHLLDDANVFAKLTSQDFPLFSADLLREVPAAPTGTARSNTIEGRVRRVEMPLGGGSGSRRTAPMPPSERAEINAQMGGAVDASFWVDERGKVELDSVALRWAGEQVISTSSGDKVAEMKRSVVNILTNRLYSPARFGGCPIRSERTERFDFVVRP